MTPSDSLPMPEVPFRGIESFRFIDQQIFAERDDEVWDLQSKVTRYRAVLLYGESGTGKSSLINAGFIPSGIKKNLIVDRIRVQPTLGEELIIERISVTSDRKPPFLPSTFVASENSERVTLSVEEFLSRLEGLKKTTEPSAIPQEAEDFEFKPQSRPLLIFDQFEEFITLFEPTSSAMSAATHTSFASQSSTPQQLTEAQQSLAQERLKEAQQSRSKALEETKQAQKKILDALVRLIQDESLRIKLLFVFREDYLAKLNILFERVPDLLDQYMRLLPPSIDVVTRIIRAPFERLPGVFVNRPPDGLGTEISAALAEQIKEKFIERSDGGALNLSELEIVCRRLWESKNPESLFSQKQIGGVLEDYFSEKLSAFPGELQEPAVALLSLMITADNTRNIISEADLFSRVQKEEEIIDLNKATKARDLLLGTRLVWRELRNGVYFYTIASDYLAKWIANKRLERVSERELRKLAQQSDLIKLSQQDQPVSPASIVPELQTKGSFDERAFVTRLKNAAPEELTQLFWHPTSDEERCLRVYFGDERYQELHRLALKKGSGSSAPKGNVVLIPGLMGSELSVFTSQSAAASGDLIWLSAFRIMQGRLDWLRLNDSGRAGEYDIRPTGIMKRYYGELLLSLSERWNVRTFWFDWRKDINLAAAELDTKISSWFGEDSPVHMIACDMGGLVARAFMKRYARRWEKMWDRQSGTHGRHGGRLIMLGTPNHGTFATPQMITGIDPLIKKLTVLDIRHSRKDVLRIFNSFVGTYQMLPSPLIIPKAELLYQSRTYGDLNVPQNRLDMAHKTHLQLKDAVDGERMIYLTGHNQPTLSNIKDYQKLNTADAYEITMDGNGHVPHTLGLLRTANGSAIKAYYIEEPHGSLSMNSKIIASLNSLLETGRTDELKELSLPDTKVSPKENKLAHQQIALSQASEMESLLLLANQTRSNTSVTDQGLSLSEDERKIEELIARGFLGESDQQSLSVTASAPVKTISIEIGLEYGRIESIPYGKIRSKEGFPIDALAVGHYMGVLPAGPELMLDYALSGIKSGNGFQPQLASRDNLLLTQYTKWGIIRGHLAQPFFLDDPRPTGQSNSAKSDRLVAVAGMGIPGRFGVPELSILTQSLCWALGRIGKRHLASILIGAGAGNLPVRDAVAAWIRGLKMALESSGEDQRNGLQRITFVEFDPRQIRNIDAALINEIEHQMADEEREEGKFIIEYKRMSNPHLEKVRRDENQWDRGKRERPKDYSDKLPSAISTVICVEMEGRNYRFGAISEMAITPERAISLDPSLIQVSNDELAREQRPQRLLEQGRFLGELLIPDDLKTHLTNNAPLIIVLNENTARIHWELISPPQPFTEVLHAGRRHNKSATPAFMYEDFLGTSRGLTRQFPAMYSLPPEPPPPPRRTLRVLVVADPAADAHLPGAEMEGFQVANLFESFNSVYKTAIGENRVEVVKLLGPLEATRTNVIRELMVRRYDALHFSGYCVHQWTGDPDVSGWLFNLAGKELLSANDLNRIDRIPKFIFSNAIESGITPDRSQERSVDLAPAFARMFLARGVSNFVCAAWPVNDSSSLLFAQTLYAALLGLAVKEDGNGYTRAEPKQMFAAMQEARCALAATSHGSTSWGAYQHYGSPYFQFFNIEPPQVSRTSIGTKRVSAAKKSASKNSRKTLKSAIPKTKAVSKKSPGRRSRKTRA